MMIQSFLVLCLFSVTSLAGNALWEEAAKEIINDGDGLYKRYFAINPKSDESNKRWPDKTIRYCFKNSAAKNAFREAIPDAMKLWYNAGLSESEYKFVEGDSSECSKKADVLTIVNSNVLSTTIGKVDPESGGDDEDLKKGPRSHLTTRLNLGMLRLRSNIAHEIGHAWGLVHEHQIAASWTGGLNIGYVHSTALTPVEVEGEKHVFETDGMFTYHCGNLIGYKDVYNKVLEEAGNNIDAADQEMSTICTAHSPAKNSKFYGALEYIPNLNSRGQLRHHMKSGTPIKDQLDMSSIMIYPSGSGGIGFASGKDDSDDDTDSDEDERAPILTLKDPINNSDRIPKNLRPSTLDVAGIHSIYADDEAEKQGGKAYPNPDSKHHSAFTKYFKKSGDNCASGSGSKKIKKRGKTTGTYTEHIHRHWARQAKGFVPVHRAN
ncbi:Flavastacin [Zalerion maritima]|uniref:Flavastacin n=1 Tax=Zalerion maritima TaxID=339359 RepID=A0AAD5RYU6_9PEZI|nr:Flavastacin [Zalerion maritima]